MKRIAVIGAGLSGLVLANELRDKADVTVFEKSRGYGGRMATRSVKPYQFDHGTQFFTAKSAEFVEFLKPLIERKTVQVWEADFVELDRSVRVVGRRWDTDYPHYVAVPKMNQLGKTLGQDLDIRLSSPVTGLRREPGAWTLLGDDSQEFGEFDYVVSTAPAMQTAALFPRSYRHSDKFHSAGMRGCYALMLGFAEQLPLEWTAALVHSADISWISIDSSKPGRPGQCSVVVHATNAWSDAHMDDDPAEVRHHLLRELADVIRYDVGKAEYLDLHRWRFANVDRQTGDASLADPDQGLFACGDWCVHGRVEGAFTSAIDLAGKLRAVI